MRSDEFFWVEIYTLGISIWVLSLVFFKVENFDARYFFAVKFQAHVIVICK